MEKQKHMYKKTCVGTLLLNETSIEKPEHVAQTFSFATPGGTLLRILRKKTTKYIGTVH